MCGNWFSKDSRPTGKELDINTYCDKRDINMTAKRSLPTIEQEGKVVLTRTG